MKKSNIFTFNALKPQAKVKDQKQIFLKEHAGTEQCNYERDVSSQIKITTNLFTIDDISQKKKIYKNTILLKGTR